MAMDGLSLRAVVSELQVLVNGKIDKVQQPEKDLLLFTIRSDRANRKLLIHTHAENGRIQLTGKTFDNPLSAPSFCMLLRRHLLGGRIASIQQEDPDRTVVFSIASRNELMDDVTLRLIVELMGKHANLFLVGGDGLILDCLRHISPSETSLRVLLPGFAYEKAPSQGKQDPFSADLETFQSILTAANPVRTLTDTLEGVSKASATALISTCPDAQALFDLFAGFAAQRFSPTILYDDTGAPSSILPFAPTGMGSALLQVPTMSEALDHYYADRDVLTRMRRHGGTLKRTVENALSRAEHRLQSFEEAIHNGDAQEQLRINGELILSNLHNARPGASQLVSLDYYANPPIEVSVPLDPALSAQENAAKYFKQYRKGKLARDYALREIEPLQEEIAYLSGQLENIGNCDTLAELEEIRQELIGEKYLKPEAKAGKKQFSQPSKPFCYRSSDGIRLYVGKNNRQNDQLTLRTARPECLWLHVKNLTGSHVIVDFDGTPPDQTLLEAATLAAYYSSGRSSTTVPVDYTPRKFLKKPGGARPGMVIYSTNKTLYVAPDPRLVAGLTRE